jgi:hypothetical protein
LIIPRIKLFRELIKAGTLVFEGQACKEEMKKDGGDQMAMILIINLNCIW